jgi:hypothetical protein
MLADVKVASVAVEVDLLAQNNAPLPASSACDV